jgi:integrase
MRMRLGRYNRVETQPIVSQIAISINKVSSTRYEDEWMRGEHFSVTLLTRYRTKFREFLREAYPGAIDRVLRKYARHIGLDRGYSAHSMRATFITTALDNGASLEDVQSAAGHADPSTTKLYDRRGYNPEKSASFFANY